jgi:hypothetical protein
MLRCSGVLHGMRLLWALDWESAEVDRPLPRGRHYAVRRWNAFARTGRALSGG